MAEVRLTIPEIEKLRKSMGHSARYVNSHAVIAAVEEIVAGRLHVEEPAKRVLMTEPHDGHPGTEECPGCPHTDDWTCPRPECQSAMHGGLFCRSCGQARPYETKEADHG